MRMNQACWVALVLGVLPVATAIATEKPNELRAYMAWYSTHGKGRIVHRDEIPAWARKYNMNCSSCHYPAPPRLNATGIAFRWAGYRMPEEIGEKADIAAIGNYLAVRGRVRYELDKTNGEPTEKSAFALNDVSLFYSGSIGRNYSANLELVRDEEELEAAIQIGSVWGKDGSYGGFRVGQGHWLANAGVAGFDRPTAIFSPIPVGDPTTTANPFTFVRDQLGLEAYYVKGRNRIALQMLNGVKAEGAETLEEDTKRDFAVVEQLLIDDRGSALSAVGYLGNIGGLSPSDPEHNSRFYRLALSANKIVRDFEVLGGLVYSKDDRLPVEIGTPFTTTSLTGAAWWLSGQYHVPKTGFTGLTRYEFLDPNGDEPDDGSRRFVLGAIMTANVPENLRFGVEYGLHDRQGAAVPKQHSLRLEIMLSF